MLFRCLLKRLGHNNDADIKENTDAGFKGDVGEYCLNCPDETNKAYEYSVQDGIAGAGTEPFPARMSNVNCGRKGAAEERGNNRTYTVSHQRRKSPIAISRRLGTLNVLERSDYIKNSHGENDRKIT